MPNVPQFSFMTIFQRNCSKVLEKATLILKIGSRPFKIFHLKGANKGVRTFFLKQMTKDRVGDGPLCLGHLGFVKARMERKWG